MNFHIEVFLIQARYKKKAPIKETVIDKTRGKSIALFFITKICEKIPHNVQNKPKAKIIL